MIFVKYYLDRPITNQNRQGLLIGPRQKNVASIYQSTHSDNASFIDIQTRDDNPDPNAIYKHDVKYLKLGYARIHRFHILKLVCQSTKGGGRRERMRSFLEC